MEPMCETDSAHPIDSKKDSLENHRKTLLHTHIYVYQAFSAFISIPVSPSVLIYVLFAFEKFAH